MNADRHPAANSHALRHTGLQAETVRLLVEASSPITSADRPWFLRAADVKRDCVVLVRDKGRVPVATSRAGQ